jgi:DNA topoisomerase III
MEGAVKYLIPSTLGVGLIEGYNRIGLPKNVGRTQLRREVGTSQSISSTLNFFFGEQTERRMVQVCEGTSSKHDMLVQSLEQYKHMYVIVKREFEKVTSVGSGFL